MQFSGSIRDGIQPTTSSITPLFYNHDNKPSSVQMRRGEEVSPVLTERRLSF